MKLILINGIPATGKTTLSRQIVEKTGIKSISKDNIKEFLFDTLGVGDREWSRVLGRASSDFLYILADSILASGQSLILESAFEKAFAADKVKQLVAKHGAECIEIYCTTDEAVRRQRFIDRNESGNRHAGHVDSENYVVGDEDIKAKYAPLAIGDVVEVDTTHPEVIDIDSIIAAIERVSQPSR